MRKGLRGTSRLELAVKGLSDSVGRAGPTSHYTLSTLKYDGLRNVGILISENQKFTKRFARRKRPVFHHIFRGRPPPLKKFLAAPLLAVISLMRKITDVTRGLCI